MNVRKVVGWILRVIMILMTAVLFFFFGKITISSLMNTAAPAPNALVLGLALENGKPAGDLISRLDTAEAYVKDNPRETLILTGGNPDASGKTEAGVMHDILAERRVDEARMVLEDRAGSNKANYRAKEQEENRA